MLLTRYFLNYLTIAAAIAATCDAPAKAQSLEIDARLTTASYVLNEDINIQVAIQNNGTTPYIVDDYSNHLHNKILINLHSVETGRAWQKEGVLFDGVMVMPDEAQNYGANLRALFPMIEQGRYQVQVMALRGESLAASRRLTFDVVKGIEIGSITRPLPFYDTVARKYTLLYWPRDQIEVLFLRVEEIPPGKVVGFVQLGNVLRFVEPTIEFDRSGKLTVTHQSSRDLFIRTVIQSERFEFKVLNRERLVSPAPMLYERLRLDRASATDDGDANLDSDEEAIIERRTNSRGTDKRGTSKREAEPARKKSSKAAQNSPKLPSDNPPKKAPRAPVRRAPMK